jgi:hypothetical protein
MTSAATETIVIAPLTADERADRDRLEDVVHRGAGAFLEVGQALAEIQERRLYRETHSRFEKYIVERFDLRHSHAHRLIGATKVIDVLSPMGETLPATERQIRPLVRLLDKPAKLKETWQEIVRTMPVDDNGAKLPITGRHVEMVTGSRKARRKRAKLAKTRATRLLLPEDPAELAARIANERGPDYMMNMILCLQHAPLPGRSHEGWKAYLFPVTAGKIRRAVDDHLATLETNAEAESQSAPA